MRTETIFDTYNLVQRLKHVGMEEDQAQEVVHIVAESRQFDLANLATKNDVALLKQEMKAEISEVRAEIAGVRTKIHQMKNDILKWMIPFMMTIIALIITQMFKSSFGG